MRGQLRYISQHGYDVVYISSPGQLLDAVGRRETVEVIGIPMCRDIKVWRDALSLVRMLRTLRALRPTVVMSSTPKAGLIGGLAAWILRVECRIYVLRGLRLETASGLLRRVLWLAERVAVCTAQSVVVVSQSLLVRSRTLGLLRGRRSLVLGRGGSNGVDLNRFSSTVDPKFSRRSLGIPPDAFVFGFVGRLSYDKGIAELIAAYKTVAGGHLSCWLLLVGRDETAGLGRHVLEAIRRDPRIKRVEWVEDPADVYGLIDVLVLPTYREGFPNVVLEAGAAHKPVVTTRVTGAKDSVIDSVTGILVEPRDSHALATAMSTLLNQPEVAAKMGERNHTFVRENYSNHVVWSNLVDLLDELTGRR